MHAFQPPPYKSLTIALLFSIFLGPLGLLYASFWGGLIMSSFVFLVIANKLLYLSIISWLICCIWSVRAVETYNRKLYSQLRA